jgi:hypothetical protein
MVGVVEGTTIGTNAHRGSALVAEGCAFFVPEGALAGKKRAGFGN